jgi:FtsP/CotA-like multicopper oxidase with cupredoxin domain
MLKLLALCFFTSLIHVPITEAKTRHYKWEVKYEYKSPDCFRKQVITINGTSPGPTISAQQGDTIIVEVNNRLITESFAIHWHGIRQVELYFPFSHLSFFF